MLDKIKFYKIAAIRQLNEIEIQYMNLKNFFAIFNLKIFLIVIHAIHVTTLLNRVTEIYINRKKYN